MNAIKNYAPHILTLKFWVHLSLTVLFFIFIPVGAKILFHPVQDVVAADPEICSYRVSRSGNIHAITSPYYDNVNFKTGLCLDEAQSIAKLLQ